LEENLKIQRRDFVVAFLLPSSNFCSWFNASLSVQDFFAVLIVPDTFVHKDIKVMIGVLLEDLGFKSVLMQQASVAAALGAGLSSACVVDAGAQKISVACVEDGVSLAGSR